MKKINLSLIILFLFAATLFAQKNPLKVEQYKLKNGLSVFLNVDKSQPNVFGMVVVKGGSKRDPADATGIAHYFEHIMFKGTDKLGTVDYKKEKVFLDSIETMYDKLRETKDEIQREKIQLKINDLSIKAAQFAVPNEFDKVITKMGGKGINAFTSNEMIAYHNFFPSDQFEKWASVYSDRFIHPVFRLFQSELETVYEEKNMSADNPFNKLIEEINTNIYKGHPYQNTVLGTIEDLKNPSLRKMKEYFDTYYVANNMALILVGNFDIDKVKPIIEKKFGIWRTGDIPPLPDYKIEKITGRKLDVKRYTPIRIGVMAFKTVPKGSEDDIPMQIVDNLLANSSQTGLLDKLYTDNKIMQAGIIPFQHYDMGDNLVFFIPKLIGQSMKKVENMMLTEIEKIKKGEFSDDMSEAVKTNLKKDFYKKLENPNLRGYYIMDAFMENKQWNDMLKFPEEVDKITKDDLIKIANKYYGNDYFVLYSKTGFPKKHKLPKPKYKPIISKNAESKSEFAKKIENMPVIPDKPRFIEFGKDVQFEDLKDKVHYYYTKNDINNIFSIKIKFGIGTYEKPILDQATAYFNNLGTEKHDFTTFKKKLQKLGADISAYTGNDYTTVSISGLEENFDATLRLANELLSQMKADDKQLKKLSREAMMNRRMEKKEPYNVSNALYQYAVYGDKSDYLRRLSVNEIKQLKSDELINALKETFSYEAEVHYSGKRNTKEIRKKLLKNLIIYDNLKKTNSPVIYKRKDFKEKTVYLLNDKKQIQSKIYFYQDGSIVKKEDIPKEKAFNEYFGGGMYSLVFQEVREFRSLAYSAWARYYNPPVFGYKSWLRGGISCQSDKTLESLQIFDTLVTVMPEKPQRIDIIKDALDKSVNAFRPSFRNLSSTVAKWQKLGYNDDPRKIYIPEYKKLTFKDITDFYKENLNKSPLIIMIAGDAERFDKNKLKKYGKIIEVSKKDIFN